MENTATDSTPFAPKDYVDADDMQDFGEAPAYDAKEDAINKAQNFRNFAGQRAASIKQEAGVKIRQGAQKAKEFHHSAEDYVRENPTKAVAGALGIGILIGLIMRR